MSEKLFGTDGVRGIANTWPLNIDFCRHLAIILSHKICTHKQRVAIARDTRISGTMLQAALTAGFTSQGIDVLDLGVIPTPLCTTLTPQLGVDMSIMITASHNPYRDNGLKLITAAGDKFADSDTAALEELLADTTFTPTYDADKIGAVIPTPAGLADYEKTVAQIAPAGALDGLKIVLDSANGAFSGILTPIFRNLGAQIISLSEQPNGRNINLDCGSQHTENLSRTVVENHYDFGIAVDGDGDRIIICDDTGKRLDGDQIIAFLATFLHRHQMLKGHAAVATVYSNLGLGKYIRSLGLDFYATPVGERHVIAQMQKIGANLGGEESGHMVLSDYALTGDALLAALIVALGIKEDGRQVSQIFPIFEPFPAAAHNLRFADKAVISRIMDNPDVQKTIAEAQKNLEGHGVVLVRKSGTEPVIRLKVEDENAAVAEKTAATILDVINNAAKD